MEACIVNERIKELAEQAGFMVGYNADAQLERFAELVRQDEREECATLCKVMLWRTPYEIVVEARIRGRENT
jgi:hypothetical protein